MLAVVLSEENNHEDALRYYDKAIEVVPDNFAHVWFNKAVSLHKLKNYSDAIRNYQIAISIQPHIAEAWYNKGLAHYETQSYEQALCDFSKSIELKPNYAEAFFNKALICIENKKFEEALECYSSALSINPYLENALGDFVHSSMTICDWTNLKDNLDVVEKEIFKCNPVCRPFVALSLFDDPQIQKLCSEIFVQKIEFPKADNSYKTNPRRPKIKIGYFSSDFRDHAVGRLMVDLLKHHDQSQFEIFCFYFGPEVVDEIQIKITTLVEKFYNISKFSDTDAVYLIRKLGLHIAIDLNGHTQFSRSKLFYYRVAPIQVNYLGYPGTLGAKYMDYIIADKTVIPNQFQDFYTEKIAYLPNCFFPCSRNKGKSAIKLTRFSEKLPINSLVVCCFNNSYKISPKVFSVWMNILNSSRNSVLWLSMANSYIEKNLKKAAMDRGIQEDRIIFSNKTNNYDEYLGRYELADLFLDTFPYNAHSTGCDALKSGLPILTLSGRSFASRVGASFLTAMNTPELITNSLNEYQSKAIEILNDQETLNGLKQKLLKNITVSSLFDIVEYTKKIEGIYLKMYELNSFSLAPMTFEMDS